jgi:hypothetical protein
MASEARGRNRPSKTKVRAARRVRHQRRRRFLRWGAGLSIGFIAIAFILSLFVQGLPLDNLFGGRDAPDGPGIRQEEQQAFHIVPGEDHASYSSIPGTSGWHFAQPLAPARWGVHDEPVANEVLIHNLEHGYVNVHYNCPDGCDELVTQLAGIVNTAIGRGGKIILSPFPDMPTKIALTAWTFLDAFEDFDEVRINDFMSSHESSPNAPEATVPR